MTDVPIVEARKTLGDLALQVSGTDEEIYLTYRGRPIVALVSTTKLVELQEEAALERYRRRKLEGTLVTHSWDEVQAELDQMGITE